MKLNKDTQTYVKENVQQFLAKKEFFLEAFDKLLQSYLLDEDICKNIATFLDFNTPSQAVITDIFNSDVDDFIEIYKSAKVSDKNINEFLKIRNKYELLIPIISYYLYTKECGVVNRWNSYNFRSHYSPNRNISLLELNLNCFRKNIFHTIDDFVSIYRLSSTLQYAIKEELDKLIKKNVTLNKEFLNDLKNEMERNIKQQKKLKKLFDKIEIKNEK